MVLLALLAVVSLVGWLQRRQVLAKVSSVIHDPVAWPLGFTALLVIVGLLTAPFPALALLELSWLLALAALALLVGLSAARLGLFAWQLLGASAALLVLVYALVALDSVHFHYPIFQVRDATPGFANIRHYSDIAVGIMPLALVYVVARRRLSLAVALLTGAALSVWWYLLFLTEGRSGVLSLAVAMLVAGVLLRRHAAWPVGTLFLSALPALAGWWWLNPKRDALAETAASAGQVFTRDIAVTHDRLMLWERAWQHAIEHFPLGVGPMGFAGDGIDDGLWAYAHPHNLFLTTAAEWGIPLALLLLALVLVGCWRILQRSRRLPEADRPLYACLVMAFVGVMVNVQFSGGHIVPLSSLVMALAIGLVFGFRAEVPAPAQSTASAPRSSLAPSLLWGAMMLVMAYLLFAGWALYELSVESTRPCFEVLGRSWYFIRFWAQGRLECMEMVAPDHWLFWSWR